MPQRGAFITLEGGEGGGKSTQARALVERLRKAGLSAVATREPGGSPDAELIREALLSGRFEAHGPRCEALLFAAARIDHIEHTIEPALARGDWVVSDRFHDSTRAYQGVLGAVGGTFLRALERASIGTMKPDLTLILDLPAQTGMARANRRRHGDAAPDRFEKQALDFHRDLRSAFLAIAAYEPDRCVVVDARQPAEDVEAAIWDAVCHRFPQALAGIS